MKTAQKAKAPKFICDICEKPVEIDKGIVQHRPMPNQFKKDLAAWQKKNPGPVLGLRQLFDRPTEPDLWQLGHLECFKDIYDDYWFSLDRCANPISVLSWTAHLGHKDWFDAHDWARFIERHFLYGRRQSAQDAQSAASKPQTA